MTFFTLTQQDQKIGFPAAASTCALLHARTCGSYYLSACWANSRAQAKALWESGHLHLMLDHFHGRWLSVEQYVRGHANETDPGIMQLLYDVTFASTLEIYNYEVPVSPDRSALLETWASRGYRLEGRHVCISLFMLSGQYSTRCLTWSLAALESHIAVMKPAEQLSTDHDGYCGLYRTGMPLAHHWCELIIGSILVPLDVLIAFGIDVEASIGPEDSIYHAILRHARERGRDMRSGLWSAGTFVAAARAGMQPNVATSEWSALVYARQLRSKAQWSSLWKRPEFLQVYRLFLDLAIKALEEYGRDGEWRSVLDDLHAKLDEFAYVSGLVVQ